MADDIVTRLQARCCLLASQSPNDEGALLAIQAANEIERLRAENEKLQWELGKALDTLVVHDAVCAENEKLRAALKSAVVWLDGEGDTKPVLSLEIIRAAAAALKETGE